MNRRRRCHNIFCGTGICLPGIWLVGLANARAFMAQGPHYLLLLVRPHILAYSASRAVAVAAAPARLADAGAEGAGAVLAGAGAVAGAPPHFAVVAAEPRGAPALVHALAASPVQARYHAFCCKNKRAHFISPTTPHCMYRRQQIKLNSRYLLLNVPSSDEVRRSS